VTPALVNDYLMKFDSARVLQTIEELGDKRFAGQDGEERMAGFAAERLSQIGWHVEERVVVGSRLPWLVVSLMGWWGLAVLVTGATVVCWTSATRWPVRALSSSLLLVAALWAYLGLIRGLRFGWRLPPLQEAFIVVARPRSDRPAPRRVVLLTPLGSLSAIPRESLPGRSVAVSLILACLPLAGGLGLLSAFSSDPTYARLNSYSLALAAGLSGLVWVAAVAQTITERRSSDSQRELAPLARSGLAVLLEMARTWPAPRKQTIELVLAAVGGQALDFAGARAVFRRDFLGHEEVPTLFLLILAPGAGQEIVISSRNDRELAESAAKSLWLPHRLPLRSLRRIGLWPDEPPDRDMVALVGSGVIDRGLARAVIDGAQLQNAASLASEIALRWSKERRETPGCADSAVASADR
jgi:hypothetical protein